MEVLSLANFYPTSLPCMLFAKLSSQLPKPCLIVSCSAEFPFLGGNYKRMEIQDCLLPLSYFFFRWYHTIFMESELYMLMPQALRYIHLFYLKALATKDSRAYIGVLLNWMWRFKTPMKFQFFARVVS